MSILNRALQLPEWIDDAACAEVGPHVFFPKRGGAVAEAKSICAGCEVREKCLEWALTYESGRIDGADWMASFGVYGGKSAQERRAILRERAEQQQEAS